MPVLTLSGGAMSKFQQRPIVVVFVFLLVSVSLLTLTSVLRAQSNTTALPDLIVRQDKLAQQWVVRDEKLDATLCSVEEGGVTPGTRRIIRFTVMTPNIGDADIAL